MLIITEFSSNLLWPVFSLRPANIIQKNHLPLVIQYTLPSTLSSDEEKRSVFGGKPTLVPGERGSDYGGPLGLAGCSLFPCWVQVSSQCSPQHLPSLFPCWWLYGVEGIRLSGSRKASGARPSKSHTAARALCGAPTWLPEWPNWPGREPRLAPTTAATCSECTSIWGQRR